MTKLTEVEGIGEGYAKALDGAGIDTVEELLKGRRHPQRPGAVEY
jgi:hypothetical protein